MKRRPTVIKTDLPAPVGVKRTKTTVQYQSQKGKSYTTYEGITTSIINRSKSSVIV